MRTLLTYMLLGIAFYFSVVTFAKLASNDQSDTKPQPSPQAQQVEAVQDSVFAVPYNQAFTAETATEEKAELANVIDSLNFVKKELILEFRQQSEKMQSNIEKLKRNNTQLQLLTSQAEKWKKSLKLDSLSLPLSDYSSVPVAVLIADSLHKKVVEIPLLLSRKFKSTQYTSIDTTLQIRPR